MIMIVSLIIDVKGLESILVIQFRFVSFSPIPLMPSHCPCPSLNKVEVLTIQIPSSNTIIIHIHHIITTTTIIIRTFI